MKKRRLSDLNNYDQPEPLISDHKTKSEFIRVRSEIEKNEPNMKVLLKTQMSLEDKMELFQLFEAYAEIDRISVEKIDLRRRYIDKFNQSVLDYKNSIKFNDQIDMLENYNQFDQLKQTILELNTTTHNKQLIYSAYKRLIKLNRADEEYCKLEYWLKTALSIPYQTIKHISYDDIGIFLKHVSDQLNNNLYGMEQAKEQILILLNSRLRRINLLKCSVALLGPSGCGKTTLVKTLAKILDFPFEQISLGGVKNSEFLKGHQYTYIGAEAGAIVKALQKMKVKNGILFFDEYDKIDEHKELSSALLHITDSSQNDRYQDMFLSGLDIDLSQLWFFYSMNSVPKDRALADRIYTINVDGYNDKDKYQIIKNHLLVKTQQMMNCQIDLTDKAIKHLIKSIPQQEGIRSLEYVITEIFNKVNFLISAKNNLNLSFSLNKKIVFPLVLDETDLQQLL